MAQIFHAQNKPAKIAICANPSNRPRRELMLHVVFIVVWTIRFHVLSRPKRGSKIGAIKPPARTNVKLHFWSMARRTKKLRNIVGPQVRKLRYEKGLTQELFAARCSVLGLQLSRATLSKIEAQLRCVSDSELMLLAEALRVNVSALLPVRRETVRQGFCSH
jgi:DNA-binding XRE family transcriptional regulator